MLWYTTTTRFLIPTVVVVVGVLQTTTVLLPPLPPSLLLPSSQSATLLFIIHDLYSSSIPIQGNSIACAQPGERIIPSQKKIAELAAYAAELAEHNANPSSCWTPCPRKAQQLVEFAVDLSTYAAPSC